MVHKWCQDDPLGGSRHVEKRRKKVHMPVGNLRGAALVYGRLPFESWLFQLLDERLHTCLLYTSRCV